MSTGQFPTIVDLTSRMTGAGKQAYIAEMLSQSVVIFDDLPMKEGSEIGGHEFVFRTSVPAGAWRQYNMGVGYSKSTTAKARIGIGSLEGYSQIDRMLAEDSGNISEFRMGEDVAFIEGMGQTMEETFWYGNTTTNPAEFMGLSPFYNTLTQADAQNAQNVIDGGGSGSSNASMWLLGLGERTIFGVYPRGSKAGLTSEDKGDVVPGYDSLGNRFEAYTTWFRHQAAVCPQDWRYGVRIANIDVTAAGLAGPNGLDLFLALNQAMMLLPAMGKGTSGIEKTDAPTDPSPGIRPIIYANRTTRFWMDAQGMRNRNVLLTINDAAGKPQDTVRGIPVKVSDRLLINESAVS
jgi:hypothetical protein